MHKIFSNRNIPPLYILYLLLKYVKSTIFLKSLEYDLRYSDYRNCIHVSILQRELLKVDVEQYGVQCFYIQQVLITLLPHLNLLRHNLLVC